MIPAIFGIAGETLSADERAFFGDVDPAGYILFARNAVDRDQMRRLTDDLRALSGRADVPILIDQEGGRVARMKPPVWPAFPAPARFGALYDVAPITAIEATRANARALGMMLAEVGVNVDCLPLLDVRHPGASEVISDRSLGGDPMRVAALGQAVIEGLAEAGVVGVVKHMPGHGRALVDSHLQLPVVDADAASLEIDIAPFHRLANAPMGMTAHVVYTAWDADLPATLSPTVIGEIIRGRIGFDGLLMTDDIDMKALSGSPAENGAAAVAAGCDLVLNCWARMDEMVATADLLPAIAPESRRRLDAAMGRVAADPRRDFDAQIARRDSLLAFG
ncbi:MAG: beta-N-acetylhexosaminidase [Sphingomonas sanxanigenens]|uniref:beta-N-acetylhexosaminidase n=1 Tax=Sphingomonas sanxanigenens TaxID=397260 RepID=A0A2W5A3S0_9SPHN|nr:MAG: beta-N-acetylhexosaminidase [Sphingomonas sanxanigenens]